MVAWQQACATRATSPGKLCLCLSCQLGVDILGRQALSICILRLVFIYSTSRWVMCGQLVDQGV